GERNRSENHFRIDPAMRGSYRKPRLDLHAIGQYLFHVNGGGTEERGALVVLYEVDIDRVFACRGFISGLVIHLGKTDRGQGELFRLHLEIARIDHFRFDGQPGETSLPIALFDHERDVHLVSGPINAAVGEDESVQVFRQNFGDAIDVEPRKIQHAIVALVRNEADVITEPRDIDDRLFLVVAFFDRGKRDASVGGTLHALERDPVSTEHFDRHASKRLAGLD